MKIQAIILSLCILCTTVASSQWTTSSNDIYNSNSGNVGIGTSSPGYKLHVDGQAKFNSSVWTDRLSIGAANVSTEQFYIYNSGSNVIIQNTSTGGYIRNLYQENGTSKFLIGYNLSGSDQKFGIYDYSTSANEFVVDGGKIGIGTASPAYKLDVNGVANFDNGGGTGTLMRVRVNGGYATFYGDASSDLHFSGRLHVDQAFFPDGGMQMNSFGAGIALNYGPISGVSTLTFNSSTSYIKLLHDYNAYAGADDQGVIVKYASATSGYYPRAAFQVYSNSDPSEKRFLISSQGFGWLKNSKTDEVAWIVKAAASQTADIQQWQNSSGTSLASITASGSMAIGNITTYPSGYKLAVAGNIIAEKVRVKLQSGWPDYVFSEGYSLPTLKETEQFIKQNNHLPGVPSAAQIEKEGLDLGDGQAVLLKKIEELTLHLIELDKKVEKLAAENEALKKRK